MRSLARVSVAVIMLAFALAVTPSVSAVAPTPLAPDRGDAAPPAEVVVEGATAAEAAEIAAAWDRLIQGFPRLGDCIGPLSVTVVDRAEDYYGGPVTAPIAAFYRFPPSATIFVEHGKVDADNLIHEMAHHVDITCGLSEWQFGAEFLEAQGFAPGHSWIRGSGWSGVPAEHFAEAVVEHLAVAAPDIAISSTARILVATLAREALLVA